METPQSQVVALLPMKRHSARVNNKNFRDFAGKPLFAWMLSELLSVDEIDLIVINTDAVDLLADHSLMQSDRVLLRERPEEICGDMVSMNLVIADDMNNVPATTYLMTHTTNPLLRADTIRNAIAAYQAGVAEQSADSLFTVNKFQTRFYREDGSAVNHDPKNLLRTQDLEPWYEENSNMYIFSKQSFAATDARIGQKPILFETPMLESVDIDDQAGWDLAETLANSRKLAASN